MKVPLSWLREHVEVGVEPRRLGEDLTRAGLALDGLDSDGKDWVLDLDITTNRVDCMNVYGVAREVSALYGLPLRPLALEAPESGPPGEKAIEVTIEAGDLCPRFCARVLDVRLAPSPAWIRDRLEQVGVRPINNVVDLTNYVMLEMGHPSHAFDLARIPEGRLRVRWARPGERLTTLDGVPRTLGERTGVVAGPAEPLALAGIMGGASSEVSDRTRTVALEAAYWQPLAIRRAAKALGMHTEASHRFERGADPEGPPVATARIAHLLGKIGAGTVRPGLVDRWAAAVPRRSARLRPARVDRVLGTHVPEERGREILGRLGFAVEGRGESLTVGIPTWRGDVSREEDLIEEVGRHHGLDRIAPTLPPARRLEGLRPWQVRERLVRTTLVAAGLTEVMNYSFTPARRTDGPAVALQNPLSEEQNVLRTSLVVPGLLATLATNLRQGRGDVAIFELGRVFAPADGFPREQRRLGLLLAGSGRPAHWSQPPRAADFFDVKGILEALTRRLELTELDFEGASLPQAVHPGQGAVVKLEGERIGYVGALHPDLRRDWELRDDVYVAEIEIDGILERVSPPVRFAALPRFPGVSRDLSVLWDAEVPAARLTDTVRTAGGALLRGVTVVDRYHGEQVPPGKVSLTLRLWFQDPGRTLTGDEADEVVASLKRQGLEIRGE